ncbi:hypothetical protein ACJQWK_02721 [Exserohilum turcicum]
MDGCMYRLVLSIHPSIHPSMCQIGRRRRNGASRAETAARYRTMLAYIEYNTIPLSQHQLATTPALHPSTQHTTAVPAPLLVAVAARPLLHGSSAGSQPAMHSPRDMACP